jgi:hypothetical protein
VRKFQLNVERKFILDIRSIDRFFGAAREFPKVFLLMKNDNVDDKK